MLELNPALHPQVFDRLVFHMKANLAHKGHKVGHKVPKAPAKSQGPEPKGRAEWAGHPDWAGLASDLSRMGVSKTARDALITWANAQSEQSRRSPAKLRVLHPMERELISPEAYEYLLEITHLGLINPAQLEYLIENVAYLSALPARKEHLQKMVVKIFAEELGGQGLNTSH